jgi:hypothetical protein
MRLTSYRNAHFSHIIYCLTWISFTNAVKNTLPLVHVTLTTVSVRWTRSDLTEYTTCRDVTIGSVKHTGNAAPKDINTKLISLLVAGRCQRVVSGCTAPTKNMAAPTRNLQNLKDKHADQKRDPWRQYHEADS